LNPLARGSGITKRKNKRIINEQQLGVLRTYCSVIKRFLTKKNLFLFRNDFSLLLINVYHRMLIMIHELNYNVSIFFNAI